MSFARLTAVDRLFLDIEDRRVHMHIGGTCIFDPGPLAKSDGGIDSDAVRTYIESRLHLMPRLRQRIAYTPVEGHPVWVDDEHFNIRYHVRHTSVPRPGDARQLKRVIGWINSQQLDRGKPLWEMWIIEGLPEGRFALVTKTHHCMVDGISGSDLLSILLSPNQAERVSEPHKWYPESPPGALSLLAQSAATRVGAPIAAAFRAAKSAATAPAEVFPQAAEALDSIRQAFAPATGQAAYTPVNKLIGSQRRFDWFRLDLAEVKAIKSALGGKVNDVVLTAVAGGMGRFLELRGMPPHVQKEGPFRAFCPVSLRSTNEQGTLGNRVSNMITELPLAEHDPLLRYELVCRATAASKKSGAATGTALIENLSEWTTPRLLSFVTNLMAKARVYNLVVTNVPGPPLPLYLVGAPLKEIYPLVPLFRDQGLGIALFSYDGTLFWGINADRDLVPDLHDFSTAIEQSYAELRDAAGVKTPNREVRDIRSAANVKATSLQGN
jgi:WS/DGAT/MGAT family acyltransferase